MNEDDLVQQELTLNRFRRLMGEMIRGVITRNVFQQWEMEILADMNECEFDRRRKLELLRQYQRAVERQLQSGPGPPMKFSEFLEIRARKREPEATRPLAPDDPPAFDSVLSGDDDL